MKHPEHNFSCSQHTNFSISERVKIGANVTFGPKCQNISIGYGTILGRDLYIDIEELSIGEYTTIHHGAVISGEKAVIGTIAGLAITPLLMPWAVIQKSETMSVLARTLNCGAT